MRARSLVRLLIRPFFVVLTLQHRHLVLLYFIYFFLLLLTSSCYTSMHKQRHDVFRTQTITFITLYLVISLSCNFRVSQHFYSLSIKAVGRFANADVAVVYPRIYTKVNVFISLPLISLQFSGCVDSKRNIWQNQWFYLDYIH